MENHALSIGAMKTDCKVLCYPPAVAALTATFDRALAGPFPALLAGASEPWLDGHQGVIRIKSLKLELAYTGNWDENMLAGMLAARVSEALRSSLDAQTADIRIWPNPLNYMASYIELRLGLTHEPPWAFPDFDALRLLPPLEAAMEIVKARPDVLTALARNGRRTGNPFRFIDKLNGDDAARLVSALIAKADPAQVVAFATARRHDMLGLVEALEQLNDHDVDRRILKLASIQGADGESQEFLPFLGAAVLAVACAHIHARHQFRESLVRDGLATLLSRAAIADALPPGIPQFMRSMLGNNSGTALANTIVALLETRSKPVRSAHEHQPDKLAGKRPKSIVITSPFAGFALLLPDVMRLSLARQIGVQGVREAALSIIDGELRGRLMNDSLIAMLFPDDETAGEPQYPPVPEIGIARLAPESRGMMTGRQGADGWGDYLLASFASRLPGLRTSSRGYLLRQFLHVQGSAEISDDVILVNLDGPPLAIILKMAGLSGDQMRVPHLNNRLLVLNLGGWS